MPRPEKTASTSTNATPLSPKAPELTSVAAAIVRSAEAIVALAPRSSPLRSRALKVYLAPYTLLQSPVVDEASGGQVFESEALAGEEGYFLGVQAALYLPCDDLPELANGLGENRPSLYALEKVTGFEAQLLTRVYGDEARAFDDVAVDLGLEEEVGPGGVDVGAGLEPLTSQHRLFGRSHRHHDVLSRGLLRGVGGLYLQPQTLAHLLGERLARLFGAAVNDDAVELLHGGDRL